jgi:hypothetical protein
MLPACMGAIPELCQSDAFALAFTDQLALELSEPPHHIQEQLGHGRVFSSGREILLLETNVNTAFIETEHNLPQIIKVSSQTIHRMTGDSVSLVLSKYPSYSCSHIPLSASAQIQSTVGTVFMCTDEANQIECSR